MGLWVPFDLGVQILNPKIFKRPQFDPQAEKSKFLKTGISALKSSKICLVTVKMTHETPKLLEPLGLLKTFMELKPLFLG